MISTVVKMNSIRQQANGMHAPADDCNDGGSNRARGLSNEAGGCYRYLRRLRDDEGSAPLVLNSVLMMWRSK